MNDLEARKLVAIAIASCPDQGFKLDRTQIDTMGIAWTALLADISYDDGRAALKRYLATSHWLPAPAQLRAIVAETVHGRARPGGDAWGDVLKLVGRFSVYRYPTAADVADPVTWACISRLGWRELCNSTNQTADRARFIELYDQLAEHEHEDRTVETLPGVARPALPQAEPVARLLGTAIRLADLVTAVTEGEDPDV